MAQNNQLTIAQYMRTDQVNGRLNELLGKRAPQFITSVVSAANENKALAGCEPASVVSAALTAAALDLPINQNLGFAYLIPYKNKAGEVCQFQMGYKGFIQLAQRSGYYKTINVTDVREGEIENIDRLTGEMSFDWCQDEAERATLPVIGYVAFFKLLNGFEKSLYMTYEELKAHGQKYSKSFKYGSGLWATDFDAMASKTVLKLLISKYGPLSAQLKEAIVQDQTVNGEYEDNPLRKPELTEEQQEAIKADASNMAADLIAEAEVEQ